MHQVAQRGSRVLLVGATKVWASCHRDRDNRPQEPDGQEAAFRTQGKIPHRSQRRNTFLVRGAEARKGFL